MLKGVLVRIPIFAVLGVKLAWKLDTYWCFSVYMEWLRKMGSRASGRKGRG